MAEIQTFNEVVLTTEALKLLAAAQVGDSITLTRAAIGDGYLPDGSDGSDLTDLVSEVESRQNGDEGTAATVDISKMEVDGSSAQVTVTIKNGDTAFYLREVGIFAEGADGNEILYAYTNAGDGAYPIPENTSANVTRILVLGIVVSADAEITANITYGEVTAEEFAAEVEARKAGDLAAAPYSVDLTIKTSDWNEVDGVYTADMSVDGAVDTMVPIVSVAGANMDAALEAGMYSFAETGDGVVTFYAASVPDEDIAVTIALIKTDGSTATLGSDTTVTYTLPVATATTLGGVKIGDGISITEDGVISVDTAEIVESVTDEVIENVSASDEEATEAIADVMGE